MDVVFLVVFVDCFRRDIKQASRFVSFVNLYLQPAGNLLGRPAQPEARFNELSGLLVSRKLEQQRLLLASSQRLLLGGFSQVVYSLELAQAFPIPSLLLANHWHFGGTTKASRV